MEKILCFLHEFCIIFNKRAYTFLTFIFAGVLLCSVFCGVYVQYVYVCVL